MLYRDRSSYLCLNYVDGMLQTPVFVAIDAGDPTWSSQVRSLTWFKEREARRRLAGRQLPRRYTNITYLCPDRDNNLRKSDDMLIREYELEFGPRTEWPMFQSTAMFYNHIRYDSKSKAYLTN